MSNSPKVDNKTPGIFLLTLNITFVQWGVFASYRFMQAAVGKKNSSQKQSFADILPSRCS